MSVFHNEQLNDEIIDLVDDLDMQDICTENKVINRPASHKMKIDQIPGSSRQERKVYTQPSVSRSKVNKKDI